MATTGIPIEAWQAALNIAGQRLAMLGDSIMKRRRLKKEADRILAEARQWPLSRCVAVLPYVGHVEGHISGLYGDGKLRFVLAVIWLAPFPAHYVSLDFRCELIVPDDPAKGQRTIVYTVRNRKVVDETPGGHIEYLGAGSIKVVECELSPDSPVSADELGPGMRGAMQTRLSHSVEVKAMQITAHAPWSKVRDTEYIDDLSFWVPRW